MRFAGRITEWNDDKGFGFAVPNGGGTRTFVHISQFSRGSRRPVVGDFISYLPVVDGRGRSNAQQIRHAGAKAEAGRPSSQSSRMPRAALGAVALAIGAVAWGNGLFPPFSALDLSRHECAVVSDVLAGQVCRARWPQSQPHPGEPIASGGSAWRLARRAHCSAAVPPQDSEADVPVRLLVDRRPQPGGMRVAYQVRFCGRSGSVAGGLTVCRGRPGTSDSA